MAAAGGDDGASGGRSADNLKDRLYRDAMVAMIMYDVTSYQSFVNATTVVRQF